MCFLDTCVQVCKLESVQLLYSVLVNISCPTEYIFNPHSRTCFRRVHILTNWADAKGYCERDGEYLATFKTLESAKWFSGTILANEGE